MLRLDFIFQAFVLVDLVWFGLIHCLFMCFGPNGKVGCDDKQLSDAHLQANFSDVMTRTWRTRCARCSVGKCRRVSSQRVLLRFKSRERCLVLSAPPQPCSHHPKQVYLVALSLLDLLRPTRLERRGAHAKPMTPKMQGCGEKDHRTVEGDPGLGGNLLVHLM
jgi:hypothetical protein